MGDAQRIETAEPEGRHGRRRQQILMAATRVLARDGVKGMRLAAVAEQLGLTTNSVSYYYRRKEDLAVACMEQGLAVMDAMIADAMALATPAERVRRMLALFLEGHRRVRMGEAPPISIFSDIRTLTEPSRSRMLAAYIAMQRRGARLFEAADLGWMDEPARLARAQLVLEIGYWSEAWLPRYSLDDLPRVHARLADIMLGGLAAAGRAWAPVELPPLPMESSDRTGQDTFLQAATRLINERGYRGASINDIAGELSLTKGSFYHHHETKDDLVVACFRHSYERMRSVQRDVRDLGGDHWQKLTTAVAALSRHQLSPDGPLLRTTALAAIPPDIRDQAFRMSRRVSDHFAAIISDGIADGSIRAVDAQIAAETVIATVNAASDLPLHTPVGPDAIAELYARPLLVGLFTRP